MARSPKSWLFATGFIGVIVAVIVGGLSFWIGSAVVVAAAVSFFAVIYRVRKPRTLLVVAVLAALGEAIGIGLGRSQLGPIRCFRFGPYSSSGLALSGY
jgi:hypothetical protein